MPVVHPKVAQLGETDLIARFCLDLEDPEVVGPANITEALHSVSAYCRYATNGYYRDAQHLTLLAQKLEAVERGEITRLMVFMPPRHGKSETASKKFPSWYLGRNPQKRVILASYGDELARDAGRTNRNDLEAYGKELFGVSVAPDSSAANRWDLAGRRGGMITAGVGGPVTGRGAHLLIIDDPFKDWQEAQSPTIRERVWNWYRSVAHTRLQKGGAIIIIQTRWHEDDLSGKLLEEMQSGTGDKWDVLNLPCEAEENDQLGRAPGESLWPEGGYDAVWLSEKKAAVGAQIWAALYQQRPSPTEGGILKRFWWRFWAPAGAEFPAVTLKTADGNYVNVKPEPLPDKLERRLQSWDMAFKDTKASAYVVGQVWGKAKANKYLLDQVRDKMDFVRTIQAFKSVTEKWSDVTEKLIEDKANGPAVISALRSEISGIIAIEPDGSKEARAFAVSPQIEAGNVYLPHPHIAPWVWEFIEECASFPNGAYADQVDATTQALTRLERKGTKTTGMSLHLKAGHRDSPWKV